MDPNANLAEQLELADSITESGGIIGSFEALRLAELIHSLDDWIVKGGFLPRDWEEGRKGK